MPLSKESIRELLLSNDRAVERAIVALYKRQTASEQYTKSTHKDNGVGFSAADARVLSSYAQEILGGYRLQAVNLYDARQRVLKYTQQLFSIAMEKQLQQLFTTPSSNHTAQGVNNVTHSIAV